MKNLQYENFINLVSAYINQNYTDVKLKEPDWKEIYDLAVLHNLSGMLYLSLVKSNFDISGDILEKFRSNFFITVQRSAIQENVAHNLINILTVNGIKHILFKGFVLKDYYPDKEIRTMGDIDIIIDQDNQDKINKILLAQGFLFDEFDSHKDVRNYSKNGVCFEIHTKLVEENIFKEIDLSDYFGNCFEKVVLKSELTYEFTPEDHLIYLIIHMAKHFKTSGCGVRMLLDLCVLVNKVKNLNWNYIKEELEKLRIYDFANTMFCICSTWFDLCCPFTYQKKELEIICDYIIRGGVFGYHCRNIDAIRINTKNSSFALRIANVFNLVFPSYKRITERYVWAQNTSIYMLPILWIRLWWYRAFKYKEKSLKRIFAIFVANEDAVEHNKLMKLVGLDISE